MNDIDDAISPQIDFSYYRGMASSFYQRMSWQYEAFNNVKSELNTASSHVSRCRLLRETYGDISGAGIMNDISTVQSIISMNMNMLSAFMVL